MGSISDIPVSRIPRPQPVAAMRSAHGVWSAVRRRLALIVTMFVVLFGLFAAGTQVLPARFKSTALVEIVPSQDSPTDSQRPTPDSLPQPAQLRTEIDLLNTRVIQRVVKRLNLVADPEFQPGLGLYGTTVAPLLVKAEGWIAAATRLDLGRYLPAPEPDVQIDPEARRAMVVDAVKSHLAAATDGRSYSISISVTSDSADKAALIANTMAEEYFNEKVEQKEKRAQWDESWLSKRLVDLRTKTEDSQAKLQRFRSEHQLEAGRDGMTPLSQQLNEYNTQLVAAQVRTTAARSRLQEARRAVGGAGSRDDISEVLGSPLIQGLRAREAEIRQRAAEMQGRLGAQHPAMQRIESELRDIDRAIGSETGRIINALANDVAAAEANENAIRGKMGDLQKQLSGSSDARVTLSALEREATAAQQVYTDFLSYSKQLDSRRGLERPDARIIAWATPAAKPDLPGRSVLLALAAILSAVLTAVLVYVFGLFDQTLRTAAQVESLTGVPVVGTVPLLRGIARRKPNATRGSTREVAFVESMRAIRVNLQDLLEPGRPKGLLVTSSLPREGKSTFCLALGRLLAASGYRVLLVDADLRRPSVGGLMGDRNADGVAQVLGGRKPLSAMVRTDALSPLHYLASQPFKSDPQLLFTGGNLERLNAQIDGVYDVVIWDAPPLGLITDALVLARYVDSSLFVLQWGKTSQVAVKRNVDQLAVNARHLRGVVLTQADPAKLGEGEGYHLKHYRSYAR